MLMSLVILGGGLWKQARRNKPEFHACDIRAAPVISKFRHYSSHLWSGIPDRTRCYDPYRNGLGSGFFIRPDGLLVTNSHLIDGARHITGLTYQGPSYYGTVVVKDDSRNLVLVKINATDMPVLRMAAESNVHVGSEVLAIGTPGGARLERLQRDCLQHS